MDRIQQATLTNKTETLLHQKGLTEKDTSLPSKEVSFARSNASSASSSASSTSTEAAAQANMRALWSACFGQNNGCGESLRKQAERVDACCQFCPYQFMQCSVKGPSYDDNVMRKGPAQISFFGAYDNTCTGKPIRTVLVLDSKYATGLGKPQAGDRLYPKTCYQIQTIPEIANLRSMKCDCFHENHHLNCRYYRTDNCVGEKFFTSYNDMSNNYLYAGDNEPNGNCFWTWADTLAQEYAGNLGKMWVVTNMLLPYNTDTNNLACESAQPIYPNPAGALNPAYLKQKTNSSALLQQK